MQAPVMTHQMFLIVMNPVVSFKMALDSTIASEWISGLDNIKERNNFMLLSNAYCSKNLNR